MTFDEAIKHLIETGEQSHAIFDKTQEVNIEWLDYLCICYLNDLGNGEGEEEYFCGTEHFKDCFGAWQSLVFNAGAGPQYVAEFGRHACDDDDQPEKWTWCLHCEKVFLTIRWFEGNCCPECCADIIGDGLAWSQVRSGREERYPEEPIDGAAFALYE